MRIAHISALYLPYAGGLERVMHELSVGMSNKNNSITVFTSKYAWSPLYVDDKVEGMEIVRLKCKRIGGLIIMPGLLLKLIVKQKQDIYHVHLAQAFIPEIVCLAAKLKRSKFIVHFHLDVRPSGRFGFIFVAYKKIIMPLTLRVADKIIVPTQDYVDLVNCKYQVPLHKIIVIANGTNHRIRAHPKKYPRSNITRVLTVSRLSVQKNIPLLLHAIHYYNHHYKDTLNLTVIGKGDQQQVIEQLIVKLKLQNVVHLTGALHGLKLEKQFEGHHIFALTSSHESFGLVFIEAMTKGLPIVTLNIPAVRKVVVNGLNGLLTEDNIKSVATAFDTLMKDKKLYEKFSTNNLISAAEYTWGNVVNQVLAVYQEVNEY